MSPIETLDDALRHRRHEVSEAVSETFRSSVRAVLASEGGRNPIIIGSCMLLRIDEREFVVTAAHILDELDTHAIYIAGTVGTEPVQILGVAQKTSPPPGGRQHDKIDIAFWELDQPTADKLGHVSFIEVSGLSHNKAPLESRLYLAMGYPASRNKKNVNNVKKSIKTSLSKYTGELSNDPAVSHEYGVTGKNHLFLKFHKYSETKSGERRKTFTPNGLSGGPLIDLGNFASPDRYKSDSTIAGYVAGMIIERITKHQVLVATRIQVIVEAIRSHRTPSQSGQSFA
jgi:hypothetical protein